VWSVALPWDLWRAVIAALRLQGVPHMIEHADRIEAALEGHGPEEATVRLTFTDDVFLRSVNWAGVTLGIALNADRGNA